MPTILCFGDSNTWGALPGDSGRHPWSERWPGVLQQQLGDEYRIIEEGLCGRTTAWDDPLESGLNGLAYLSIALQTHNPIDLLVVMLGTNDVKTRFNLTAFSIAQGAAELLQLAIRSEPKIPRILLISPPHVSSTDNIENTLAFEGAIEKSRELSKHYEYFAEKHDCFFFDAATVIESSAVDGIHLDAHAHRNLAFRLHSKIEEILKNGYNKRKKTHLLT